MTDRGPKYHVWGVAYKPLATRHPHYVHDGAYWGDDALADGATPRKAAYNAATAWGLIDGDWVIDPDLVNLTVLLNGYSSSSKQGRQIWHYILADLIAIEGITAHAPPPVALSTPTACYTEKHMKPIPDEYQANVGKWATIQSRHQTANNGRTCRIAGVQQVGKTGKLYYRVNCIGGGLHPGTERLYLVNDLIL